MDSWPNVQTPIEQAISLQTDFDRNDMQAWSKIAWTFFENKTQHLYRITAARAVRLFSGFSHFYRTPCAVPLPKSVALGLRRSDLQWVAELVRIRRKLDRL